MLLAWTRKAGMVSQSFARLAVTHLHVRNELTASAYSSDDDEGTVRQDRSRVKRSRKQSEFADRRSSLRDWVEQFANRNELAIYSVAPEDEDTAVRKNRGCVTSARIIHLSGQGCHVAPGVHHQKVACRELAFAVTASKEDLAVWEKGQGLSLS